MKEAFEKALELIHKKNLEGWDHWEMKSPSKFNGNNIQIQFTRFDKVDRVWIDSEWFVIDL